MDGLKELLSNGDLAVAMVAVLMSAIAYLFRRYEEAKNEVIASVREVLPIVQHMNSVCDMLERRLAAGE